MKKSNEECPFCSQNLEPEQIVLTNEHCIFIQRPEPVLTGSGLIIPKKHRGTVFDLTPEEIRATFELLQDVKNLLEQHYNPDGYNIGWNSGEAAGQEIFHAHLHVIPRYADEPYAGKGIRHWLKKEANRRR
jgi:diadenosine tetraphosphate (Ap4A) HIT family hydrolase